MLTHAKPIAFVLTPDHARAAAWYRDVLGLTLVGRWDDVMAEGALHEVEGSIETSRADFADSSPD